MTLNGVMAVYLRYYTECATHESYNYVKLVAARSDPTLSVTKM